MTEIDPRLDARLRSFYEHIEEQRPPVALDRFDARESRPRTRVLNIVLGSTAVVVVGAAAVGFALELNAPHLAPARPAVHATPVPTPLPTFAPGPPIDVPNDPVANPSFEEPQVNIVTPVTSLPGWTVAGSVQLIPLGTIGQPRGGNQYLLLTQDNGSPGEVTQRVKTVAGVNYEVIFSTGTNPECVGPAVLDVYWNGRLVSGIATAPAARVNPNPDDLNWSTDAFASALATGSTSTIGFMAEGACGAALDEVILEAQPPPGS